MLMVVVVKINCIEKQLIVNSAIFGFTENVYNPLRKNLNGWGCNKNLYRFAITVMNWITISPILSKLK